jgi:hypothetical protein
MNETDIKIEPSEDFVTGFNMGYTLARFEPEMSLEIEKQLEGSASDRSNGFRSGLAQYAMEKDKTLQPEWERGSEPEQAEAGKEAQADKDDLELELD